MLLVLSFDQQILLNTIAWFDRCSCCVSSLFRRVFSHHLHFLMCRCLITMSEMRMCRKYCMITDCTHIASGMIRQIGECRPSLMFTICVHPHSVTLGQRGTIQLEHKSYKYPSSRQRSPSLGHRDTRSPWLGDTYQCSDG